eukprot:CAMPEP_0171242686 /NCGR_PEP_ID=MMETSP0790-20130122/45849_1 /TAXON_ID=2925 /ORGANISM="Alexandrium catenella, Strain OF101" /LENGTH=175 /DNA_ID=CAMNT_0011709555 /DNA_START=121 /DNA_END=648 /DNA_ORIENTATION=+
MAQSPVVLGFLVMTLSMATLVLTQALATKPAVMEVVSSASITADVNSTVAADWIQVLQLKELAGLPPMRHMPNVHLEVEGRLAAAEELVDDLRAVMPSGDWLRFVCRCFLDMAVLFFVAVRLKPWDSKASPADDSCNVKVPSKPKQSSARASPVAETPAGSASARDLLLAWDSFA